MKLKRKLYVDFYPRRDEDYKNLLKNYMCVDQRISVKFSSEFKYSGYSKFLLIKFFSCASMFCLERLRIKIHIYRQQVYIE